MKLTLKIDWVTFTFPSHLRDEVEATVAGWLGSWHELEHGFRGYRSCKCNELGAHIAWSAARGEACCDLPGRAWDAIPEDKKLYFLQLIVCKWEGKFTRGDVALDDWDRSIPMELVHEAAERDNFTGFHLTDSHRPKKRGRLVGDSRAFGRPGKAGSGKFLLVYDKNLESEGKHNSIRWEARFYKEWADLVFKQIAASESVGEFRRRLGRAVGSIIDFVERGQETHVDRMRRVSWWYELVAQVGRAEVSIPRVVPPLRAWVEHMRRCVLGNLRLLEICYDGEVDGEDAFWEALKRETREAEGRINWRRQASRDLRIDFAGIGFGRREESCS